MLLNKWNSWPNYLLEMLLNLFIIYIMTEACWISNANTAARTSHFTIQIIACWPHMCLLLGIWKLWLFQPLTKQRKQLHRNIILLGTMSIRSVIFWWVLIQIQWNHDGMSIACEEKYWHCQFLNVTFMKKISYKMREFFWHFHHKMRFLSSHNLLHKL